MPQELRNLCVKYRDMDTFRHFSNIYIYIFNMSILGVFWKFCFRLVGPKKSDLPHGFQKGSNPKKKAAYF